MRNTRYTLASHKRPRDRQTDTRTDRHTDRQTDRHTDRQTDMTKLIVSYRNFANRAKNGMEIQLANKTEHVSLRQV
jgi:hypothetical protein